MTKEFLIAIALVMVIEGVMPFLNPPYLRKVMQTFIDMDDKSIRLTGLISMVCGVILLYWVN